MKMFLLYNNLWITIGKKSGDTLPFKTFKQTLYIIKKGRIRVYTKCFGARTLVFIYFLFVWWLVSGLFPGHVDGLRRLDYGYQPNQVRIPNPPEDSQCKTVNISGQNKCISINPNCLEVFSYQVIPLDAVWTFLSTKK